MIKTSLLTFAILFFVGLVLIPDGTVSAEEASKTGIRPAAAIRQKIENIKEKILEKKEDREASVSAKKEQAALRVRQAAIVRWEVLNRAINRSELLLGKLQVRIDKAKSAGKDVTAAEAAMTDAKTKLADAKSRLEALKTKKDTAIDKTTFKQIQNEFRIIQKDLNAIRNDAAKIIRELKAFNAEVREDKKSTTSAVRDLKESTKVNIKRPATSARDSE